MAILWVKGKKLKNGLRSFELKVSEAKDKLQGVISEEQTVGIYEIWDKSFYVFGDNWGRGGQVLYKALGLNPPQIVKDTIIDMDEWKQITLEVLPEYAADYMFFTRFNAADTDQDALGDEIKGSAIYKSLEATKNNQTFEMNFKKMYFDDPYALEGQLELIVEALLSTKK